MKAVIVATGRHLEAGGIVLPAMAEFLPVAGRPVIQRCIELLADRGVKDITFLLREEPERFRAFLGTGERWGVKISILLCGSSVDAFRRASELAAGLGDAIALDALRYPVLPGSASPFEGMPVPDALTMEKYLDFALMLLRGRLPGMVPPGRLRSEGIRVSHHVSIHPTARLNPPVFLADGVEVGADSIVGPDVVLERGVIIGKGSEVVSSVLLPWTMIGDGLDIRDAIVDGGAVHKPRSDAAIVLDDTLIVSSWRPQPLPANPGERLLALCLLGLAAPVLYPSIMIAALSTGRPLWKKDRIIATPYRGFGVGKRYRIYRRTVAFPKAVCTLAAEVLPELVNVVTGVASFAGLPARIDSEIARLQEVHASVALTAKTGLLGEWRTLDPDCDEWERFASEAWQSSGQRYPRPVRLRLSILKALLQSRTSRNRKSKYGVSD